VAAGSDVGKRAKTFMDAGKLVPDEVVIGVAEQRLAEPDANKGFILDGFPRTAAQADALDRMLPALGVTLERCVTLLVDEEELVKRLLKRARIEGRSDDNEQAIRTRMQVYKESTAPLIAYYRGRGVLREIDGEGSVDEVAKRLEQALA
jgi:adenylate kinase